MSSRFPAPIDAILETAATWTSGFGRSAAFLWNGAVLWVLVVTGLAAASFVGAFEYQSRYTGWTGTPAARTTNDGVENFASFNRWKTSVEEALKAAALREQRDRAKSSTAAGATKPNDVLQDEAASPSDLGIDREVARMQANTLNQENESNDAKETGKAAAIKEASAATERGPTEQTKEPEPFSQSPVIDPVSPERLDLPQWRHGRRAWGRGRWHGRHYAWSYNRLIGVARAFPFAVSVR